VVRGGQEQSNLINVLEKSTYVRKLLLAQDDILAKIYYEKMKSKLPATEQG
jgi:hypothetical protein